MDNRGAKKGDLEGAILEAVKKVGVKKENDLCRFLPGPSGGYIHHFTLRKMKTESPAELMEMIKKSILNVNKPKKLPHKPRAPRGSRKRLELLNFSRTDMDRLMQMVRKSGDKDMIRKLMPKRDLKSVKRELISSIRHGRIEPELWNAYAEQVTSQNAYSGPHPEGAIDMSDILAATAVAAK